MKIKIITYANIVQRGLNELIRSLDYFGYDYEILGKGEHFYGMACKQVSLYEWCKKNKEYDYFVFADGYDSFFLSPKEELINKIEELNEYELIVSVEKNCYPDFYKANMYPSAPTEWKYINAGGFAMNPSKFVEMFEKYPLHKENPNDQDWFTDIFLNKCVKIKADYECKIFQTIWGTKSDELSISEDNRIYNELTDEIPCIIHGNGQSDLTDIYKLI